MSLLEWSDTLHLGQPVMDETHQGFVELLNRFAAAGDSDRLARLGVGDELVEAHFRQEEAWMERMQFPPLGCHRTEHEGVLEVMREVRRRIAGGQSHYGAVLAQAIAEWFPLHAQSMDTVLALYIRETGFQPETTN